MLGLDGAAVPEFDRVSTLDLDRDATGVLESAAMVTGASFVTGAAFAIARTSAAAESRLAGIPHDHNGAATVVVTAPFGYARLRREAYDDEVLEEWAERFRDSGWEALWVFFKHEDAGTGPRLAAHFADMMGADG